MRQSVQELMERYQNNLFAAAFNVCKSKEDAEDVVQDTFLQYHMNKNNLKTSSISGHGCSGWQSTKQRTVITPSGGKTNYRWKIIWKH